jgi:hypothetical protein
MFHGLFPNNDKKEYCLEKLEQIMTQVQPNESFIRKTLQANIDKIKVSLKKSEAPSDQ